MLFAAGLTILHVLAGAVLLGAMLYSLTVVQPRARAYFTRPEEFEEFTAFVSRGARWRVVAALAIIGLSGAAVATTVGRVSTAWTVLFASKGCAFVLIYFLFVHVSWRLWPARVFAAREEIPLLQQAFRRVGAAMILLVGLSLVAGVLMRFLR